MQKGNLPVNLPVNPLPTKKKKKNSKQCYKQLLTQAWRLALIGLPCDLYVLYIPLYLHLKSGRPVCKNSPGLWRVQTQKHNLARSCQHQLRRLWLNARASRSHRPCWLSTVFICIIIILVLVCVQKLYPGEERGSVIWLTTFLFDFFFNLIFATEDTPCSV